MVTLGEVLSLATTQGAIMGKILWVFRSLENAFATIADLKAYVCPLFFIKFLLFHQMTALQNL